MTDNVRVSRPNKDGVGRTRLTWVTPVVTVLPPDGLVSVYIGPLRQSPTVHRLLDGILVCMPNVPVGAVEPRPEFQRPTCGRCLALEDK